MDSVVPQMHAETGYEEDSAPPLRASGIVCLILGLLSIVSTLGQPLLVIPLMALIAGGIALRRWSGERPAGTGAAMVGIVLATGFGACGFFLPFMKSMTLGGQAERFARRYLDVVAAGHDEFALELKKDYVNRFPTTMSLPEHYELSAGATEPLEEFRHDSINKMLKERGVGAEWVLDRPIRVYYQHDREHADLVFADPTGETPLMLQMSLEYRVDSKGDGQWHVELIQAYREKIVAPVVL